jgi:hypothetical protein
MGSRVSSNNIDDRSNNSKTSSTNDNNVPINNSNTNEQKLCDKLKQSHVYIKDKFQLEFLDCNCSCDTTKKIANCDFQGINILQDLYEMVSKFHSQRGFLLFDSIMLCKSLCNFLLT